MNKCQILVFSKSGKSHITILKRVVNKIEDKEDKKKFEQLFRKF